MPRHSTRSRCGDRGCNDDAGDNGDDEVDDDVNGSPASTLVRCRGEKARAATITRWYRANNT